ncbi:MAG TPA: EAL domain-containing protein [Rhodocyclaceae bacterium]|nr:EAL domain-containing protein [Rhodocyclaceae bacterium]
MNELLKQDYRSERRLITLAIFATLTVAFLLLVLQHWISSRNELVEQTQLQAAMIGAGASAALTFNDPATGEEVLQSSMHSPLLLEVALYRPQGQRLASLGRNGDTKKFGVQAPKMGKSFGVHDFTLVTPVPLQDGKDGRVALRVSLSDLHYDLLRFISGLAAIGVLSGLIYLATSHRLRRRMEDAESAFRHLALHDRVTGLSNRYAFELALDQTVRRHERSGGGSALLFLDLDGFKKVNDLYGHHTGDELLTAIAMRLSKSMRDADVVARLGGDEFGIIVMDCDDPDAVGRLTEQLLAKVAEPYTAAGRTMEIGLSIGIAMIPQDGATGEELLRHADMAMYQVKANGKNKAEFFSERMGNSVRANLDLEADLRPAIPAGQLYVEYQPQVCAKTRAIIGMEALVRWRHPARGFVSPGEFIPIAEESDLIIAVGNWVLHQVCKDIADWRDQGLMVPPVAYNVSARQFARGRVAEEVIQALRMHNLPESALEVELTESVVMEQPDDPTTPLSALRASGLRIAIDDFGTGYSSLSYLKRLPVDKLKVDRSFIADLPDDVEDRAITGAIISLAKALGLRVVAEGVETEPQAELLLNLGCDIFQGYLTGRPMGADKLAALLPQAPIAALEAISTV